MRIDTVELRRQQTAGGKLRRNCDGECGRSNFDRLADLFPRWPNLYADTSALTLYTRWRVLLRLAERTDLHARLVHGSDFPLPPTATLFAGRIPVSRWWDAWKRENGLRRDFAIKQSLGLPAQIYTRGYEVLGDRVGAGVRRAGRVPHLADRNDSLTALRVN